MQRKLKQVFALALLSASAGSCLADESSWLVRARVVDLNPANQSEANDGLGLSADAVHINRKTIPEVDISYFWTKNIATELVLTVPQKQKVTADGSDVGSFKHLPPSVLMQYHFCPDGVWSPYIGAGLNYTYISSVKLDGGLGLDRSSVGPVLQAGLDYKLDPSWSLNVDVKKVQIRSDVKFDQTKITNVKIDPILFGVGIGYRF